MIRGTVKSFDRADGFGDIELEDGRVVRFGFHAVRDKDMPLDAGANVLVDDVAMGFGGRLRAALVCDPIEALPPGEKLTVLLARPTRSETLRSLYRSLDDTDRQRLGRTLIEWTFAHGDQLGALAPVDMLSTVPLELWTDDEVAQALGNVREGRVWKLDDELKRFIKAAKARLGVS